MKYFNLRTLIVFLALNTVTLTLNNIWTSDKGWLPFIASLFIGCSILFWLIQSIISLIRNAKLKNEYFYYFGLGLWNILITIDYFKLRIFESTISDFVSLLPYVVMILFWLLPIKVFWSIEK
ncbi:hypothetical protein BC781_1301 [Sediminitomix flava]|uniref:Uncharacterized protein n=1 Tax=Sediminitomix flava TaxID=379075 RepID=A0A315YQF2_SEDFL|nr:hypothetical protein BC781_1301 [Sediminitomix flava]